MKKKGEWEMERNIKSNGKIPGMLYMLVSFAPWVVYWVLCGVGNKLGVVIPLAISLLVSNGIVFPDHQTTFHLSGFEGGLS